MPSSDACLGLAFSYAYSGSNDSAPPRSNIHHHRYRDQDHRRYGNSHDYGRRSFYKANKEEGTILDGVYRA